MNPVEKNPSDEHSQCVAYSINNAVFLVLFAKSFGLPRQDTYFFYKVPFIRGDEFYHSILSRKSKSNVVAQ